MPKKEFSREEVEKKLEALKISLKSVSKAYSLKVKAISKMYLEFGDNDKWNDMIKLEHEDIVRMATIQRNLQKEISDLEVELGMKEEKEKEKNNTHQEKLIQDLRNYLDKIADKIIKHKGPGKIQVTNQIGDQAWAVLDSDLEESNLIINILRLLEKKCTHKVDVWGIGMVEPDDVFLFKEFVKKTDYFKAQVPKSERLEKPILKKETEPKKISTEESLKRLEELAKDIIVKEENGKTKIELLPSDEEILARITDKDLVLAQIDTYMELKNEGIDASIYQKLIYRETGLDLSLYDDKHLNHIKDIVGSVMKK